MKFKLNRQVEKDLRKINDKVVLTRFKEFLEDINYFASLGIGQPILKKREKGWDVLSNYELP